MLTLHNGPCETNAILSEWWFGRDISAKNLLLQLPDKILKEVVGDLYVTVSGNLKRCGDAQYLQVKWLAPTSYHRYVFDEYAEMVNLVRQTWQTRELSEGLPDTLAGLFSSNENFATVRQCDADGVILNAEDPTIAVPIFSLPSDFIDDLDDQLVFINGYWTAEVSRGCYGWGFVAHPIYSID